MIVFGSEMQLNRAASAVLAHAQREALTSGNGVIGPVHILLGILSDDSSSSSRLLREHGISLSSARSALVDTTASPPAEPREPGPLDRSSYRVIRRAYDEARLLRHRSVSPLHLLLGLIRVQQDIEILDFDNLRMNADDLHAHIMRVVVDGGTARSIPEPEEIENSDFDTIAIGDADTSRLTGTPLRTHPFRESRHVLDTRVTLENVAEFAAGIGLSFLIETEAPWILMGDDIWSPSFEPTVSSQLGRQYQLTSFGASGRDRRWNLEFCYVPALVSADRHLVVSIPRISWQQVDRIRREWNAHALVQEGPWEFALEMGRP